MPATVVIGGQWGDEGKGRIVDLLARDAQVIARYSAGHNAGHTVVNDLGEFRLHLVPAGIFYPDKTCVIGNGCVVHPPTLIEEIDTLRSRGVSVERLAVSDRAHVVMPYHPLLDRLEEERRGANAVGTTGRGVGPAYVDKVARSGVRVADLVEPQALRRRIDFVLPKKNVLIEKLYGQPPLDGDAIFREYAALGRRITPFVTDTSRLALEALDRGEELLLEGAQGSLLDLDSGTYDFVTSSVPSSTAAGAAIGIGIGPRHIRRVVGIYKAYMTRVGNGPMPTEDHGEEGARLRERGHEYGTTTGRPRRCGWFDAVASRYSARLNGVTEVCLTRLDVLDSFPVVRISVAYELDGRRADGFPSTVEALERTTPVFEELPGWQQPTGDLRRYAELPANARRFVERVEELLGVPIMLVSVGPERDQAVRRS